MAGRAINVGPVGSYGNSPNRSATVISGSVTAPSGASSGAVCSAYAYLAPAAVGAILFALGSDFGAGSVVAC
jgi:hypothetical protein